VEIVLGVHSSAAPKNPKSAKKHVMTSPTLIARPAAVMDGGPLHGKGVAAPVSAVARGAGGEIAGQSQTGSMADRKLRLLQRTGLFGEDTKGATVERACTLDDLREAYRLVHDVYLGTGFIRPEASGLRLRIFETSSDTATFVAKVNGRVVGVLSIVGDSPDLGLPSDSAFKEELDALRARGSRVCEVTNQAVAEEYRKSAVPTELMRCAITHAWKAGYHEGVATVSPSHNGFYDLLGFRQLGSQRSYSQKLHDPVVALSMELQRHFSPPVNGDETERFLHQFMAGENRFLHCVADWAKIAKRNFLNPDFLQQLFVTQSNFIATCSAGELKILHRRWGHEMFEAVTANVFEGGNELCAGAVPCKKRPARSGRMTARPFASGTVTPFLDSAPEVFENFGERLQRFATAARDQITHPFLDLWSWSDAPFEARESANGFSRRSQPGIGHSRALSG
jgi:ribosomal protein S18 acetylase RimI-like enzyme